MNLPQNPISPPRKVPLWLNLAHTGFQRSPKVLGFEWELRRRGETHLGLWRRKRANVSDILKPLSLTPPLRIVVLPGFLDSPVSWLPVVASLPKRYEVILLDYPSYLGRLWKAPGFKSLERMREFVSDVLDSLRPEVVLGHSLGGWLAADWAATPSAQGALKHLMLLSPAGIFGSDALREVWARPFVQARAEGFRGVQSLLFGSKDGIPAIAKPLLPMMERFFNLPETREFLGSVREEDFLAPRARQIQARVDLIWGAQDSLILPINAQAWIRELSSASPVGLTLLEAGHCAQLERPFKLARTLKTLLA